MSDTESFESVAKRYDNCTWIGRDGVKRAIDRLKAAHDREIRDVSQQQYRRGFEDGQHSMDAEHRAIAMRLRHLPLDGGSHENLSQIARAIYHSDFGWTKGACMSLRDELVRLMGGVSDDTCGAGCGCAAADCDGDCGLQREEVTDERLADDCGADTGCGDRGGDLHMAGVTYDTLGNERRKAVCELRKLPEQYKNDGKRSPAGKFNEALGDAIGIEGLISFAKIRDRLIHLLGGNECNFSTPESDTDAEDAKTNPAETTDDEIDHVSLGTRSITGELRQCVETATKTYDDTAWHEMDGNEDEHTWCSVTVAELLGIADRIDQMAQANGTIGQLNGTCPDDVPIASITDELREWASDGVWSCRWEEFKAIADRIDEQFDRICAQQEAVLQSTIERMADENLTAKDERDHWKLGASELQEKLDEYDSTHVELPMDANGEVFRVGCTVKMVERHQDVLLTVHSMTLCDDGEWLLHAQDDEEEYFCNQSASEFEVCDKAHDTAESIVRELSMGAITESEAIGRIEALNG